MLAIQLVAFKTIYIFQTKRVTYVLW